MSQIGHMCQISHMSQINHLIQRNPSKLQTLQSPIRQPQTPAQPQTSSPINKEIKKELQKQQKIFQQLEEQIGKLSEQKAALEASLIDPAVYSDKNKFLQAEASYKNVSMELENLNHQYEKTFELIVSLEAGANG